jgi:hypothetical protein
MSATVKIIMSSVSFRCAVENQDLRPPAEIERESMDYSNSTRLPGIRVYAQR